MPESIIKIINLNKQYRLGKVGARTFGSDVMRWWSRLQGREDPLSKVGVENSLGKKDRSEYIWALKDIDLEIKQGEVFGIVGKNGAGKSTLLKILSRVTLPTSGSITVYGRIASLLEVGTGFHPELTGRENIFLNGAILGMTKAEIRSKFDEIVDFSGVERYIDTPVKRYSSGMYVRLAFAVAAHLEPEILVVDEVLAVGDVEFQKKALGKMNSISTGEGRTVLFVSHNMESIRNLCSKGILLSNGTIRDRGSISDVIQTYESLTNEIRRPEFVINKGDLKLVNYSIQSEEHDNNLVTFKDAMLNFIVESSASYNDASVAVCFDDIQGRRITSFWNLFQDEKIRIKEGLNKINVEIKNIALSPGEYYIVFYIESKGVELLRIENLARVLVKFDSGKAIVPIPKRHHGYFLQKVKISNE